MSNMPNWEAIKAQSEQSKKSFYRQVWERPPLNQKGSFIMKLDVEPVPVYTSYDPATKKYTEHPAPGKGISTKWGIAIDYTNDEGQSQDTMRVSKSFYDKLVIDVCEFVKEYPTATRAKVMVRTVTTSKGDSETLDFINLLPI